MTKRYALQLPTVLPRERLLGRLRSRVKLACESQRESILEFYDSFDRDLWFAERVLYRHDDELVFAAMPDLFLTDAIGRCRMTHDMPGFADQLPTSSVQSEVIGLLKIRAILPMARVLSASEVFAVKNEDGKTVVRLRLQSLSGAEDDRDTSLHLCTVETVRGYGQEADALLEYLHGLGLYVADTMAAARVLGELAAVPERHPAKPARGIDQAVASREDICRLLRDTWETARSREAGVTADIDTEFLHEYRVAIRRMRSLVAVAKDMFPVTLTQDLRSRLRALANATNPLRDLDVYLLSRPSYERMLPHHLLPGLGVMFSDFASQRERELDALRGWLTSPEYASSAAEVHRLLESMAQSSTTYGRKAERSKPASVLVAKRYKRIASTARQLHARTRDADLHELRIQCKKLRYSLEFFGAVLDPSAAAAALKNLKRLQDALGAFNDLSVQQVSLSRYLADRQTPAASDANLVASIGGLLGALFQRQIEVRGHAMTRIAEFTSESMASNFDRFSQSSRRAA